MSKINKIPLSDLEKAVKESYSCSETCRKLRLPDRSGTASRLRKHIINNNIDTSHWTGQLWSKGKTSLEDDRIRNKESKDIFSENSNASPYYVRKLIIKRNLLEYKCQICLMDPFWNNKEIKFQLDHVNGCRTDHRLENLRWLCPNCHSQTETYGGKNKSNAGRKRVSDEELLTALEESANIRQALIRVDLDNGRNYERAKKLLKNKNMP
jgi:Zn finger protein HypA/HybF involved in hydrogenase expression